MFPKTTKFNAMFPHTGDIHAGVSWHTECVCCLSNRRPNANGIYSKVAGEEEDICHKQEGGHH